MFKLFNKGHDRQSLLIKFLQIESSSKLMWQPPEANSKSSGRK